eukprot:SAG31_NODE_21489_length_548_cov_0.917595_1_plen_38_part_10
MISGMVLWWNVACGLRGAFGSFTCRSTRRSWQLHRLQL